MGLVQELWEQDCDVPQKPTLWVALVNLLLFCLK